MGDSRQIGSAEQASLWVRVLEEPAEIGVLPGEVDLVGHDEGGEEAGTTVRFPPGISPPIESCEEVAYVLLGRRKSQGP